MRREKRVALKPKGNFRKHFRNDWMLYAMLLPVLLWYVIFCYLPMGGISLAFKNYQYNTGLWHSPWIDVYKRQGGSPGRGAHGANGCKADHAGAD